MNTLSPATKGLTWETVHHGRRFKTVKRHQLLTVNESFVYKMFPVTH